MLLAAQLAQEPKHEKHSKQLFKASRIQDFLDSIRASLIDYGAIRRSQTLLGSTVGSIDKPHHWISQQAIAIDLEKQIEEQLREFESQVYGQLEKNIAEARQQTQEAMNISHEELRQIAAIRADLEAILRDVQRAATPSDL